jgi:hypothetical protein
MHQPSFINLGWSHRPCILTQPSKPLSTQEAKQMHAINASVINTCCEGKCPTKEHCFVFANSHQHLHTQQCHSCETTEVSCSRKKGMSQFENPACTMDVENQLAYAQLALSEMPQSLHCCAAHQWGVRVQLPCVLGRARGTLGG